MNTRFLASLIAAICLSSTNALAEVLICHQHAAPAPESGGSPFQYAPDRDVDVVHFALDVTPNYQDRTVAGKATIQFKPIAKPLDELRLHAVDLTVLSVSSTHEILGYMVAEESIVVTFSKPIAVGEEASVSVGYRAQPRKGLYFRTPEMGYKPEDMHIWTQGEPHEARHWYPSYDYPNEKFTSEVTCRVPEGMVVLSNGKKISEEKEADSNLVAVRWLQEKPHVNYLISLLAGHFKGIEDKYKDLPIAFYTPASQVGDALNSFKDTKDMLAFFEAEIGVDYPWAKYYQVVVDDFSWGGMENTSITTLSDRTLHRDETENLRSSQGLVAHELAHQWFGDLLTCKDWSHLWLNEGFATYYDALYEGHKNGPDAMLLQMWHNARSVTRQANDVTPMVRRDYNDPVDQFGYLAYPKGSWILHMLRSQLGAGVYRQCIKTFTERNQFKSVVTEDLNSVIEELSGRSFDQFFDQYVYHAHHPELAVTYGWDTKSRLVRLSIRQTQKLGPTVRIFSIPLTIRFKTGEQVTDRVITVDKLAEDFYFPLEGAPEQVRIDPEFSVLMTVDFHPPRAMIDRQIKDESDMIGRLLAVEELQLKKDNEALAQLKETLNTDPFHGVREAASQALGRIHTAKALEALLASTAQADARVRRRVLQDIAGFYDSRALEAMQAALKSEKNPDIRAVAISALGKYAAPGISDALLGYLAEDSYRNRIADAAIGAMRAQSDPVYIEPLLKSLKETEPRFTTVGLAGGLGALAYLARNEEDKSAAREFLVSHLDHLKERVQVAAINALGTLGDPKAIGSLSGFAEADGERPQQAPAEKAVASLQAAKPASTELGQLRGEVISLQKENRELRQQFEELKKRLEAAFPEEKQQKPARTRR